MKMFFSTLAALLFTASAFASVAVSSPSNGSTVGSSVHYVASGSTSTCSSGVASMGVYVNNVLKFVANGSTLDTTISLSPGNYGTVVEEWDRCGGATYTQLGIKVSTASDVYVTYPAQNSTVSSPVTFSATATTSTCAQGVAAMGVYVNNNLVYTTNGASLNTSLQIGAGTPKLVVQEWDHCGGSTYHQVNATIAQSGNVISNIQTASGNWKSWAQLAPYSVDCNAPCPGVSFSEYYGVSNPSHSGHATQFNLGGTTPYADALFSAQVMGQNSPQLRDANHTLLPSIHYYTYDTDVYVTNLAVTQVLEFDISMYMNGTGMIWGTQCNHLGDGDWDIWDNTNAHWISAGVPCKMNNGWNHVTLQMQRENNNTLFYQSITLNGETYTLNRTYAPFSVPSNWWGTTLNFQMDGNSKESSNTVYLDNFTLTYR